MCRVLVLFHNEANKDSLIFLVDLSDMHSRSYNQTTDLLLHGLRDAIVS